MKKKWAIIVVVILVIFGISRIDFRSADAYYDQDAEYENVNGKDSNSSESTLNGSLQNNGESNGKTTVDQNGNVVDKNGNKSTSGQKSNGGSSGGSSSGKNINVTIYIDVKNLLKKENYNKLKPELRKYVPSSGYVLQKTVIQVPSNSSSFDVLQKATRLNRIQMEYQGADENIYNSVYIQGINHIYEFSAGSESGWMYSVNGKFPNYGMSAYTVKNKDVIRMVYTCNLGCDVGHSMKNCSE